MKIVYLLLVLFFAVKTPISRAGSLVPDLKFGFNSRTYPIGAQITAAPALGVPLWGDTSTWKYGYVRLATNLATSVVVNRAGIELQVYPISILGLSLGADSGVRNITPKYLDCSLYQCNGIINRKFLKFNAVGAYHGVILTVNGRYEELTAIGSTKPFFDEMTLLTGNQNGEHVFSLNPALLYTLNDTYKVGFTSLYSHAIDANDYSHLYGPIAVMNTEPRLNLIGGVGLNRSPVVNSGWAAFFVMQYTFKEGLNIADQALRTETYSSLF